jgi:Transposase DDE domain
VFAILDPIPSAPLPSTSPPPRRRASARLRESHKIDAHIATGRQKHGAPAPEARPAAPQSRVAAMAEKLRAAGREGPYRLRKQVVEPVFGQIKQARGFRQFLRRRLVAVQSEWTLVCTVHNLLSSLQCASRCNQRWLK